MITIINGPNLNLLGKREPEIYGNESFEHYLRHLRELFPEVPVEYCQSNIEGELVDYIQKAGFDANCEGIIINPGAYSHYSVAIADALAAVPVRVVEVHLSNIHAREEYRHKTLTGEKAAGIIAGLGLEGYRLALEYLTRKD